MTVNQSQLVLLVANPKVEFLELHQKVLRHSPAELLDLITTLYNLAEWMLPRQDCQTDLPNGTAQVSTAAKSTQLPCDPSKCALISPTAEEYNSRKDLALRRNQLWHCIIVGFLIGFFSLDSGDAILSQTQVPVSITKKQALGYLADFSRENPETTKNDCKYCPSSQKAKLPIANQFFGHNKRYRSCIMIANHNVPSKDECKSLIDNDYDMVVRFNNHPTNNTGTRTDVWFQTWSLFSGETKNRAIAVCDEAKKNGGGCLIRQTELVALPVTLMSNACRIALKKGYGIINPRFLSNIEDRLGSRPSTGTLAFVMLYLSCDRITSLGMAMDIAQLRRDYIGNVHGAVFLEKSIRTNSGVVEEYDTCEDLMATKFPPNATIT